MKEPVNDLQSLSLQASTLSREPIVVAAVVTGLIALVGISIAAYTYLNTAEIYQIPIYRGPTFVRYESKTSYLFMPVLFLVFPFAIFSLLALWWEKVKSIMSAKEEFYKTRSEAMRKINVRWLLLLVLILWTLSDADALYDFFSKCLVLLGEHRG
jgi:hypothetical protein